MVPKSPIEHPSRHHSVLTDALFQVDLQVQDIDSVVDILINQPYFILPYRNYLSNSGRRPVYTRNDCGIFCTVANLSTKPTE